MKKGAGERRRVFSCQRECTIRRVVKENNKGVVVEEGGVVA